MQMELMVYPSYYESHADLLDHLEEIAAERKLIHYASELLGRGFRNTDELEDALIKAFTEIRAARLPVHYHFKKVFISCEGDIRYDWLVSDLGMRLIILNADANNPILARLKVEVAERF